VFTEPAGKDLRLCSSFYLEVAERAAKAECPLPGLLCLLERGRPPQSRFEVFFIHLFICAYIVCIG
jgi:hypothetical protein